jgi:hypothetical protein
MSTTAALLLLFVVLAVIAAAFAVAQQRKRQQRQFLQERFGPEYERLQAEHGRASLAERELLARQKRVQRFKLRDLSEKEQASFTLGWSQAQVKFVDEPNQAVRQADELIKALMAARGYPVENFEQRVADLSVDHANVVQHYRAARALADGNREGRANTEELRQAFVHYRALFGDLLQQHNAAAPVSFQEARA